jgi:predicted outer membrane repeat protein
MTTKIGIASVFTALQLLAGAAIVQAAGVVGTGTPASCTPAALLQALAGGGSVTFDCGQDPHTIVLPSRQTIAADTTIDGADRIVLSGGKAHAIFTVQTGRTVTLRNLTLRDAAVENWAVFVSNGATLRTVAVHVEHCVRGGIYNAGGTVDVTDSTFADNDATAAGAAITNEGGGTLTVLRSLFSANLNGAVFGTGPTTITESVFGDNHGDSAGGGAILHNDELHVIRCRFDRNHATAGGAILASGDTTIDDSVFHRNEATVLDGGAVQLFNQTQTPSSLGVRGSTFDENLAARSGGAVRCDAPFGTCTFENTTFSRNTATMNDAAAELSVKSGTVTATHVTVLGGGSPAIERVGGTLTMRNSVIDDGTCTGGVTDGGGNVQGAPDMCAATFATGDPALFALADNGGPTPTHEIRTASAAFGAAGANCLPVDQRGVARSATGCDAGAFERGAVPTLALLEPNHAGAGGPAFTMIVHGTSFLQGATPTQVLWNGTPLPAVVTSSNQLAVSVPAELVAVAGVAMITVENPNPPVVDGGVSATGLPFTIDDGGVVPPPPPPPPPPAEPCDGLTGYDAVLCAVDQARIAGHFCAAADLDAKLDRSLQAALGKASTFVSGARDATGKKIAKLLKKARAQLAKLAKRTRGKKAGSTTAACRTSVADGANALATRVAGLGQ